MHRCGFGRLSHRTLSLSKRAMNCPYSFSVWRTYNIDHMAMQNLSKRNRVILYIFSILIVLSMIISAVVSFTPPTPTNTNVRPTATVAR